MNYHCMVCFYSCLSVLPLAWQRKIQKKKKRLMWGPVTRKILVLKGFWERWKMVRGAHHHVWRALSPLPTWFTLPPLLYYLNTLISCSNGFSPAYQFALHNCRRPQLITLQRKRETETENPANAQGRGGRFRRDKPLLVTSSLSTARPSL